MTIQDKTLFTKHYLDGNSLHQSEKFGGVAHGTMAVDRAPFVESSMKEE